MRKPIITGEFYHIYNRGVDKRDIFNEQCDTQRFLQSMREFNVPDPIGSLYENRFPLGNRVTKLIHQEKLVNILAYCLNPNHFHFILEQTADGGIGRFMKKLCGGYSRHFNEKYDRSGALFQGAYKHVHIDNDSYMRHLSVYVNLNDKVHQLGDSVTKSVSSFGQYVGVVPGRHAYVVENKEMILSHFKGGKDYEKYALETLPTIIKKKEEYKSLLIED